MTADEGRRAALGALLRARREQLRPQDLGMEPGPRRRTPGLRREEVATIAGVSVTYLTYLEQGRDVRPSTQVLDALAAALRMDETSRQNLFELANGTPPPFPEPPAVSELHPVTLDLLDAIDPAPAYVADWRGDIIAMNRAGIALFGDEWTRYEGIERNGTHWMLADARAAELFVEEAEHRRRRVIARFRPRADRYRAVPAMQELLAALRRDVPDFDAVWSRHEVAPMIPTRMVLDHPLLGRIELGHHVMTLDHGDDQRLVTYPPRTGSAVAQRLAELAADAATHPAFALSR